VVQNSIHHLIETNLQLQWLLIAQAVAAHMLLPTMQAGLTTQYLGFAAIDPFKPSVAYSI